MEVLNIITNTNKTNAQSLSQLINEHPDLPVIPLICNSFSEYYNLYTDYTTGCIGTSFISKYCYYKFYDQKEFVIYEDIDSIEDYLLRHHVKDIKVTMSKIEWTPAIFFYLVNPH